MLQTLNPCEISVGYLANLSAWTNLAVATLGAELTAYLFRGTLGLILPL